MTMSRKLLTATAAFTLCLSTGFATTAHTKHASHTKHVKHTKHTNHKHHTRHHRHISHSHHAKFDNKQKTEIRSIVRDYLISNPSVLLEASQALQKKQLETVEKKAKTVIRSHAKQIFNNPNSPVMGKPHGNITLVEFLDYQCGHCQQMAPIVRNLIAKNPDLRVVIKELPIIDEQSEFAARVAIAASKLNPAKFAALHEKLFSQKPFTEAGILDAADVVNYDTSKLKNAVNNDAYKQQLKDNAKLAEELALVGTPAFIIANRSLTGVAFVPGATNEGTLQALINNVRKANDKK